jgi:hypothetical protein
MLRVRSPQPQAHHQCPSTWVKSPRYRTDHARCRATMRPTNWFISRLRLLRAMMVKRARISAGRIPVLKVPTSSRSIGKTLQTPELTTPARRQHTATRRSIKALTNAERPVLQLLVCSGHPFPQDRCLEFPYPAPTGNRHSSMSRLLAQSSIPDLCRTTNERIDRPPPKGAAAGPFKAALSRFRATPLPLGELFFLGMTT